MRLVDGESIIGIELEQTNQQILKLQWDIAIISNLFMNIFLDVIFPLRKRVWLEIFLN